MRIRASIAALVGLIFSAGWTTSASADPLDPALSRLVLERACQATASGNQLTENVGQLAEGNRDLVIASHRAQGVTGTLRGECRPDSKAFKRLVNEWGFALAPAAMYPARTTGFGGFEVTLQAAYTKINHNAEYWTLGTEGERDSSTGQAALYGSPPSVISLYSLNIRKNFGFGFEALANVGYVPNSSIINGGADIRVSLLEGFRKSIGGFFPDVAAGGGIRTITGVSQMQLTTVTAEARASKPFPFAGSQAITPYIGYQYLWIFGRSGLIDLTPGTDPLKYCGFQGTNIPSTTNNAPADQLDGQPICTGNGSVLDLNNNAVFDEANLERQRMLFGLDYRYEFITGGVQFLTDVVPAADAQVNKTNKNIIGNCDDNGKNCSAPPRQWQLSLQLGVRF